MIIPIITIIIISSSSSRFFFFFFFLFLFLWSNPFWPRSTSLITPPNVDSDADFRHGRGRGGTGVFNEVWRSRRLEGTWRGYTTDCLDSLGLLPDGGEMETVWNSEIKCNTYSRLLALSLLGFFVLLLEVSENSGRDEYLYGNIHHRNFLRFTPRLPYKNQICIHYPLLHVFHKYSNITF